MASCKICGKPIEKFAGQWTHKRPSKESQKIHDKAGEARQAQPHDDFAETGR